MTKCVDMSITGQGHRELSSTTDLLNSLIAKLLNFLQTGKKITQTLTFCPSRIPKSESLVALTYLRVVFCCGRTSSQFTMISISKCPHNHAIKRHHQSVTETT